MRSWLRAWPALLFLLLVVGLAIATSAIGRRADNRLERAQIEACNRVNELRTQFNVRGAAVVDFVATEIRLEQAALTDSQSSQVEKVSAQIRISALQDLASAFTQAPLTACPQVVLDAGGY